MKNWESRFINLGVIPPNKKKKVIFKATEDLKIKKLSSSCGCTKPKYNKDKKELVVIYSPGNIPYHLKGENGYTTSKSVTVVYEDGTKDVLSFNATITK